MRELIREPALRESLRAGPPRRRSRRSTRSRSVGDITREYDARSQRARPDAGRCAVRSSSPASTARPSLPVTHLPGASARAASPARRCAPTRRSGGGRARRSRGRPRVPMSAWVAEWMSARAARRPLVFSCDDPFSQRGAADALALSPSSTGRMARVRRALRGGPRRVQAFLGSSAPLVDARARRPAGRRSNGSRRRAGGRRDARHATRRRSPRRPRIYASARPCTSRFCLVEPALVPCSPPGGALDADPASRIGTAGAVRPSHRAAASVPRPGSSVCSPRPTSASRRSAPTRSPTRRAR